MPPHMETMEDKVILNNKIKKRESNQFLRFLKTLERKDRAEFIKTVAIRYGVERPVVYSWCYTSVRIPASAKSLIEEEAAQIIFTETDDDTE